VETFIGIALVVIATVEIVAIIRIVSANQPVRAR
jgi:hypothetical protein